MGGYVARSQEHLLTDGRKLRSSEWLLIDRTAPTLPPLVAARLRSLVRENARLRDRLAAIEHPANSLDNGDDSC